MWVFLLLVTKTTVRTYICYNTYMSLDYIYQKKSFNKELYYAIGAVIILLIILSAYFSFRQNNKTQYSTDSVKTDSLTAQAKAEYIYNMKDVIQNQPAISTNQKASLIKVMSAKLKY